MGRTKTEFNNVKSQSSKGEGKPHRLALTVSTVTKTLGCNIKEKFCSTLTKCFESWDYGGIFIRCYASHQRQWAETFSKYWGSQQNKILVSKWNQILTYPATVLTGGLKKPSAEMELFGCLRKRILDGVRLTHFKRKSPNLPTPVLRHLGLTSLGLADYFCSHPFTGQ